MSPTFVPFDTPEEDLPGIAMTERQRTPHSFPTQQTSGTGSRRRNKQSQPHRPLGEDEHGPPVGSSGRMECAGLSQPSSQQDQGTPVIIYKRKALGTRPSPSCQKDGGGASKKAALREISEGSDEETEDDSRVCVDRHPQGNHVVDDDECRVEEDDVEEENSEREREREDREETMQDCEGGKSQQYYEEDDGGDGENDHAYPLRDDDGRQERSADVGVDDATRDRSEASVQKRKRQSSTSPTAAADKRIAKKLTVAASRQALKASQEAVAESAKKRKGSLSTRATKAEKRVPPRDVSEQTQPSVDTRDEAIDRTRCFFLEFDEDGFAKKKREHIEVDVTKILRIPEGDILFNHRTLDETLVQSICDTIHHAAKETNGKWDFMTFILAPIVPNTDGSQGRRITPEQFDVELAHTYNWYVVAGQHTAEAINRLIKDKSPAEKVYGFRSYSHNGYCKDWTNKMRGYMNLAQCGETVWPLVQKFFDMYEKGLLPRVDGVRYIDLPGKVEGRLPGQYFLKDNSGKKVLFHCIKAEKGSQGATVSILNLTPTIFKLFGDMTAREKQVALHHMMRGDVIVTSRSVPCGRCNMADLVKYTRRERYMVRMFNYILFKAEGRSKEEWSADFFIGYTTILERYSKNGLTDEKWTKERDRIPDDMARKVPRRFDGPDEINGENGAGRKANQGMFKETPFHLKCFIYEAIDCLDDLRAEINQISSCACHIFWEVGKRITTILPFEIEPKGVLTDNEEVVGTERGMKIRATILDMSTSPKCVLWDDDAFSKLYTFLITCCGENWALIIFAPMKHQKQVMQSVYNWDDVEVLTGSWYRHYIPSTTLNKYGNIAVRYTDMMAIVLHAENNNLDNITVAPKLRAELTNLNVEEGEFVRCSGECIGVEGDTDAVYSWMERESTRLRKLCSSFIREDDGVMLLGRAHAGLIWELACAGHHVFACDDTTKKLTYLSKFLEFYVKDPRNKCRFEKLQVEHRKDQDIYYKLGRKREKMWAYLFGDTPRTAVDNDYVIRKSEIEIKMNEYHGSHMGVFHMFVARCEHLYFNMKKRALSCRDYADLARKARNFNNIDCDEDTSDSDLDVPSHATRRSA
ncbi:hypothetical protein CBR_g36431 [Chara braunii]|uniref:Uncharacterized protein n=1 Tax=Chara braunii TaxID=69332 RepID=A0A388LKS1_CHABU|nr:hypothetical protein CBR_g36431 [Chara braunii]|eukprot:GBG82904.1 hypothetical protein CBR_g36431 [Chara braunii]